LKASDAGGLILSVDKPAGWTSFDVVNKLRSALHWRTVGHAGTLDPPATGVLIVLCGSATGRNEEFTQLHKEYLARVRFGLSTTTDDLQGLIVEQHDVSNWSVEAIVRAMGEFEGWIEQVPPAVSAVKVDGRRSYERARRGETAVLSPRRVKIHSIELSQASCPEIEIRISCSRGTYVRSIARDLGAKLGWGGTLASLVRTAVGPFRVEQALPLNDILRRAQEFRPE
jgi:tRNA pseudouridine55 synthase